MPSSPPSEELKAAAAGRRENTVLRDNPCRWRWPEAELESGTWRAIQAVNVLEFGPGQSVYSPA